jgi:hypothetical protein
MIEVSKFQRYVLPFVAGAPVPAVDDAVVDACVEFCTRALVLRCLQDPITLTPNTPEYCLDAPDMSTQVVGVTGAWLPEGQIDPLTRPKLDELYPTGWARATTACTRDVSGYFCPRPGLLRLVPQVTVTLPQALLVEIAIAPTRDATKVPDLLYQRYAEQIAAGALTRLHQHPDATYADPSRVATYREAFEDAIRTAAEASDMGFQKTTLETEPERW